MSSRPFSRQDAAGMTGAPLGVFVNGKIAGRAASDDPYGEVLHKRTAAANPGQSVEILLTCPAHPASSAVDCLDCEPA